MITATQIRCHQRNKRGDEHDLPVADLPGGGDLLDVLEQLAIELKSNTNDLRDDERNKYCAIHQIERTNRTLMIWGEAGRFGDRRRDVHVDTHEVTHLPGEREASTVQLRAMLFIPPAGTSAVIINETTSYLSVGGPVVKAIKNMFQKRHPDITMNLYQVMEPESVAQGGRTHARPGGGLGVEPGFRRRRRSARPRDDDPHDYADQGIAWPASQGDPERLARGEDTQGHTPWLRGGTGT